MDMVTKSTSKIYSGKSFLNTTARLSYVVARPQMCDLPTVEWGKNHAMRIPST
jgi:hypothetical protein